MDRQSTNHIMMCLPQAFCANPQTMASNAFQSPTDAAHTIVQAAAIIEADTLCHALLKAGVIVTRYHGQAVCPDDIFCNNWISAHADGTLFLYPMLAENRRLERRGDIIALLQSAHPHIHDMTAYEAQGKALESTGSLLLDRINRVAYVAQSSRADPDALQDWADQSGYRVVSFRTQTWGGQPVYHTNVMLAIGTGYAILCADIIVPEDRPRVIAALQATHEVVLITEDQMNNFCGNALEVQNTAGDRFLVMSSAAHAAMTQDQIAVLGRYVRDIIHADLKTIEAHGGGSARCMMLEVF